MQASPFSSMVTKGHFSWYAFLNVWKLLLFARDNFKGAWSTDSAMFSLIHKTFFNKWHPEFKDLFGLQLRRCDVLFRQLRRNFFCFMSLAHVQSTSESKSACFSLSCMRNMSKSGFVKFWHKSFGYSWEKSERPCLFVVVVSWLPDLELLRGYPYFWTALLISCFSGTNLAEL